MSNQVCSNYALALFELIDLKKCKEYKSAMKSITSLLKEDEETFKFVCAYGIDKEKAGKVIKSIASSFSLPYLEDFLLLIHKKHRFSHFYEIEDEFTHLVNDYLGVKEGYLYSAIKLSNEEIEKITSALGKKLKCDIELYNIIDSSLLGGVKVSIDGKVYDNSLKGSLETLSKTLLGGM